MRSNIDRTESGASLPVSTLTSGLPPAPNELLVEPELVEAARDDEVDEVVHGNSTVAPAWRTRSMFSRWIVESGVSRGQSTSLRSSLRATLAARWIRFDIPPEAIVPSVPIEHGQMT